MFPLSNWTEARRLALHRPRGHRACPPSTTRTSATWSSATACCSRSARCRRLATASRSPPGRCATAPSAT
nr:hypothetical protein [Angustibacter aerolatus]